MLGRIEPGRGREDVRRLLAEATPSSPSRSKPFVSRSRDASSLALASDQWHAQRAKIQASLLVLRRPTMLDAVRATTKGLRVGQLVHHLVCHSRSTLILHTHDVVARSELNVGKLWRRRKSALECQSTMGRSI